MNKTDGVITLAVYLASLTAIAVGIGCAISLAWSSVVVGAIVLCTVFVSLMGGRKT